ncbi:MAG: DUF6502 family protein [Pikeienuella sp.]
MAQDPVLPPANPFIRVLRGLLRPLVKAMISQGVTVPAVYRLLKEVYVEVAEQDFALDGKRPTDSRISVLTGVHRKDVRVIREAGPQETGTSRRRVAAIASVIGRWLADPQMLDATGQPRPLPRQAQPDTGVSFDALVGAVSKDVRPRTVLDELLRQRLVSLDEAEDLVRLNPEAVLGPGDSEQKVIFFAQNVGDHIAAATENLLAADQGAPFMERAVFYNRLKAASVDAIEGEARDFAARALAQVNRSAFLRQAADLDTEDATERFRFGVYFYRTPEAPTPTPLAETDDPQDGPERPEADGDWRGGQG